MNEARDDFLAYATLAGDKDFRIGWRNRFGIRDDPLNCRTRAK